MRTLRLTPALAAVVVASGFVAARAEAGIIILKNGKVFVGRIDEEDVKGNSEDGTVTMHSPALYKGAPPARGIEDFPRHDIRWFDILADEPTDDYCKDHADEPIDARYLKYIEIWKDKQKTKEGVELPPVVMINLGNGQRLSPIPIPDSWGQDQMSIRKPADWNSRKVGGIWIFESNQKGTDGYTARIHVFSCERAATQVSDQLPWVQQELEKLAAENGFAIRDGNTPPKPTKGGYDVEWQTETTRNTRLIKALRAIRFREHRTYFVSCYAHSADYENLNFLFRAVIQSLQIQEGGTGAATSERVDVSGVKVGQTYRWKSASVPDAVTWEITAVDGTTVTHKATTTAADGEKKTSEFPEPIGSLGSSDVVDRMSAIAATRVTPQKAGSETVSLTGGSFDCDIYEAVANQKRYRVWLSKRFPVKIKVVVDGTVVEELAEIK